MSINLNSLKNLSTASGANNGKIPALSDTETIKNTVPEGEHTLEKTSNTSAPKISLMKLKKTPSGENSITSSLEQAPISVTQEEVSVEKKEDYKNLLGGTSSSEETVPVKEILPIASDETLTETAVTDIESTASTEEIHTDDSGSLVINTEEAEEIKEMDKAPEEVKEFFPNFHTLNEFNLDDDLETLSSIGTPKDAQKSPAQEIEIIPLSQETSEVSIETIDTPAEISADIVTPVAEITPPPITTIPEEVATISQEEIAPAVIAETTVPNIPEALSSEYVAEVKTELSESRRGGFRFFAQKKSKIIAGVGVVFSLSVVAIFSGSFLSGDIEKSGKTNIQEIQTDSPTATTEETDTEISTLPEDSDSEIPTEATQPSTDITPVIVPDNNNPSQNYEIGRDYSVTKNTKKNIRTKTTEETSSGAEMPTP